MTAMKTKMGVALATGALATLASVGCVEFFCFVRGTRISTPMGPRNIEDLLEGDEVFAHDPTLGVIVRKVVATMNREASEIYSVRAGDFFIAGVTSEHPFWDDTVKAWRPLRYLTMESRFLAHAGNETQLVAISSMERMQRAAVVYNLTVEGPEHNYFAEGLLVHNKSPVECSADADCTEPETCDELAGVCEGAEGEGEGE